MFLAKFQIELLSPWAVGAVQSFGCEMSSLFCAQLDEGRVLDVLLFSGVGNFDELLSFLQSESLVLEFELLDKQEKYVVCKIVTGYSSIMSLLLKHKCFLLGDVQVKNCFEFWSVGSSDKKNLRELLVSLRKKRKTNILEIRDFHFESGELTQRQYELAKSAYERGYFDVPKKLGLDALSLELGVSKSTLAVHLQKAEKLILGNFFSFSNEYVRR
ncbi:helix-turn-helix domain-containing protein [Candidatus Woesearchaeota archaeon]|nr:helix-turn-helix domain-containing protein [Nanoarchaeota archaeon]MCB9371048.1 helix-turn-helix domain-containing protein [Candidatus Woesearchaeota archaeon]USN44235.1 MAG: helix-turn-helix domain-containing protein [Candidatus Woesearchaeota archaeon]